MAEAGLAVVGPIHEPVMWGKVHDLPLIIARHKVGTKSDAIEMTNPDAIAEAPKSFITPTLKTIAQHKTNAMMMPTPIARRTVRGPGPSTAQIVMMIQDMTDSTKNGSPALISREPDASLQPHNVGGHQHAASAA